ncbi:MAG: type II secretion system F family protein [Burkholderiaceae bacterium]
MSPDDRLAVFAFLTVLMVGGFAFFAVRLMYESPRDRLRKRLTTTVREVMGRISTRDASDTNRAEREQRKRKLRESLGILGPYIARLEAVGGRKALYIAVIAVPSLFAVTAAVVWRFVSFPLWIELALVVTAPVTGAIYIYRWQVQRFQEAFLALMPDVLDTITRASQAGVPITRSLSNVGEVFAWPIGPEFQRIGHSLQLGNDLALVLDEAELRIRLPDFSFLAVCLLLQRETGGSLADTLSNLATVIRGRRELRMKARALTAEGRLTAKMLSIIPLMIMAIMWFASPDYISVLFTTEAGNDILGIAGIMMLIGIVAVNRLSRLGT